jgi:hypothetical protein
LACPPPGISGFVRLDLTRVVRQNLTASGPT